MQIKIRAKEAFGNRSARAIHTSRGVSEAAPLKGAEGIPLTHVRRLRNGQGDGRTDLIQPERRRLHERAIAQNSMLRKLCGMRS